MVKMQNENKNHIKICLTMFCNNYPINQSIQSNFLGQWSIM